MCHLRHFLLALHTNYYYAAGVTIVVLIQVIV